jgi:hypothetical protein
MRGALEWIDFFGPDEGYYDPQIVKVDVPKSAKATQVQLPQEKERVFRDTLSYVFAGKFLPKHTVPRRIINRFVEAMPSQAVTAETRARWIHNSKGEDFITELWDLEHAAPAGAYADVFVTSDKNFYNIMQQSRGTSSSPGPVKADVVFGCEGLLSWLKATFPAILAGL